VFQRSLAASRRTRSAPECEQPPWLGGGDRLEAPLGGVCECGRVDERAAAEERGEQTLVVWCGEEGDDPYWDVRLAQPRGRRVEWCFVDGGVVEVADQEQGTVLDAGAGKILLALGQPAASAPGGEFGGSSS
jgi:hypothetical protein